MVKVDFTWFVYQLFSYSHSRGHSPNFPSLHLRHNLFSNTSVALPTSQLILQPLRRFTYVTAHSPTLPLLLHLRHSSSSNPSFASPASQALHLIHLASRPCQSVAAGPGSIPGRDKFPGWGFSRGFSSPVRQMSGSFRSPMVPEYHLAIIIITGMTNFL